MNISNKKILDSFSHCLKYYEPNQKSDHWKKYNTRLNLYKSTNLKNFRNNSLSQGLDDEFSKKEIENLFNNLNLEEKKFFIVKNIVADYLLPAHFGDRLEIYTTLIELKRASMILKQEIVRDNKKIFKGNVRLALLNSSGKPEKFSMDLASNIKNFFKFIYKNGRLKIWKKPFYHKVSQ